MKSALTLVSALVLVRRSPCGERGLKLSTNNRDDCKSRRSPCGERGLKSVAAGAVRDAAASLPVRGAWIEILRRFDKLVDGRESLPVRGAWIEM